MAVPSKSDTGRVPVEPDDNARVVDLDPRAAELLNYREYWASVFPFNPPDLRWKEKR